MIRFHIRSIAPERLDEERARVLPLVRAALPEWAEVVEVGSTAAPGVVGKDDLDLLVRVPAEQFDAARALLDGVLPRNPEQLSCEDYQGYTVASELDVAVQLTVRGGRFDDFLSFLEALREEPELVERYNRLKRACDGLPMSAYRERKAAFIEATLARRRATDRGGS